MSLFRLASSLGLLALLCLPLCAQEKAGEALPAGAIARLGTTRFRHQSIVNFVGYSGDGKLLITVSGEGSIRFWDAGTGKEVNRLELKVNSRRFIFGGGLSVLLSGDGKTLAFGVDDSECTVIDVATGKVRKEFKLGDDPNRNRFGGEEQTQTQLSHDGKLLIVVDSRDFRPDGKITVWDTSTGKQVHQHSPKMKEDSFTGAALSRDGKTLIRFESANRNGKDEKGGGPESKPQLRFVETATGKELRSTICPVQLGSQSTLTADGKHLIGSDRNNQRDGNGRPVNLHLIDALTGKEVHKFSAKFGTIRASFLAADQKSLFVACLKQITQYELKTGNVLKELPIGTTSGDDEDFNIYGRPNRFTAALTPDGKTLAVPAQASIAFWDVATGKETPVDQGHRNRIDSVAFGPHAKQLVTGSADGGLYLWDVATGSRVRAFAQKTSPPDEEKRNRRGGPERLDLFKVRGAFSPDGKSVAGLWWGDKLHIWDPANGKLLHHMSSVKGHTSFSYSPDGRFIALAGTDGSLGLWHADAGREAKSFVAAAKVEPNEIDPDFDQFSQGAFTTAFTPDGRTLICGGMEMEPRGLKVHVKHWEIASGQARMQFHTRMGFEGGGPQFDLITVALDAFIVGFLFSPDGKSIVEAGFANVKLRNLRSGAEIRSFGGKQIAAPTTLFSPDGKMLIAGTHAGALRVWDVANGSVLIDFPAHPAHVTALAFSPDGKWLASGAKDAGLLIWDWDHIRRQALAQQPESPEAKADALWSDLADKDAAKAYSAIKSLATTPAQAVPLLKERLRPIAHVDAKHLKKLLDDLDHPQYPVRQKADEALEKLGDLTAKAIKERREANPSVETSRRLEALQKKLDAQVLPLDVLQVLRAIETLELIGTPEARNVLDGIAKGAPGHRVTEDAKDSLRRLK